MKTYEKMLKALNDLNDTDVAVPHAQRIELKRQKSGHVRIYMYMALNTKPELMHSVRQLLEGRAITSNGFEKAGMLTSITLVDDSEVDA